MFLARWVGKLVGSGTRELTVTELRDIAGAIDGLADLPVDRRTIGALRTFLNNTDPEGIAASAPPVGEGRAAWLGLR